MLNGCLLSIYKSPCLQCVCRYALVDFGLAQGTADTQIELLKVVRQRSSQKGGGSTGKQDTTQRSKAPSRFPPKTTTTTTASTSLPLPPRQSMTLPSSSSSSSTTTSSSASRKALVKKARSVTTTVTTSTSRTKHAKVSALSQYFTFSGVFWVSQGWSCMDINSSICVCLDISLSSAFCTNVLVFLPSMFVLSRIWQDYAKCHGLCLERGTWTAALQLHPLPNKLPLRRR